MIRDVTDLEVYNQALEFLAKLYEFLRRVPQSESDTIVQLKRAAKSIPANISEGFAKRSSEKEFKRFLKIAIGSSDEVITHLRMLEITVERLKGESQAMSNMYQVLSKRLNSLHKNWRSGYF